MTIKDFIRQGGKIQGRWNFVDHCEDVFDKHFLNDYSEDVTLDGLVQMSNDDESYAETQDFDSDSEVFDIIAPNGEYLATSASEDKATEIIKNFDVE